MMTKRIIPCLDIKNGRTVKGTNFTGLRDAGEPIGLAKKYSDIGADELVFLDISATVEQRKTVLGLVESISKEINIPFAVGGGISELSQVSSILEHGADKVCVNSAAIHQPSLICEIADHFGSQCLVLAVDAKFINGDWYVYTHGGTRPTPLTLYDWVQEGAARGCGEVLFTSMDHDGIKMGFAIDALAQLSCQVSVPIIASGGAGTMEHFAAVFEQTQVTGALAASIFHYKEVDIPVLKHYLDLKNIPVRI